MAIRLKRRPLYADRNLADLPDGSVIPLGGRLTLTTAVPVTVSDVTAAGTVYYSPYISRWVPIYDGSRFVVTNTAAELSLVLDATLSDTNPHAANGNYDLFVVNDANTIRLATGPFWLKTSTVTMTIATPCVVTWNGHALLAGTPIVFTTTGALPTGLTASTTYYVLAPAANTFNVAATPGGAAINTSGSQSGTHTATAGNDIARGTGAGTTELELKNGILTNKVSMTARFGSSSGNTVTVAANCGTYVGSVRMTAAGQCEDSAVKRFLWNTYNRRPRNLRRVDTTDGWNYSTAAYHQANASTANQFEFMRGLNEDVVEASVRAMVASNVVTAAVVIATFGLDSTTAKAADATASFEVPNVGVYVQPSGGYSGYPGLGYHYLAWIEFGCGVNTQTWYGDGGGTNYQSGMTGVCFA